MALVNGVENTDWSIDRASGAIRYIGDDHGGAPTYATVIQFHRWIQNLADDASSVDNDEIDITDELPSARSTDNIITLLGNYNIDDNAAEHLFDGSIIQNSGADIYDGIVNFGNTGVIIQIIQDGKVRQDDWWNSNGGLNASLAAGISHRFMLKTKDADTIIDGGRILGTTRTYLNTYSEFPINGTSRGNNVLALSNANDLNNAKVLATVAAFTGITNTTVGYKALDVNNDTTNEFYYSEWNTNQPTQSINDFYERMKWLSKDPVVEDSNADVGSDFVLGNATIDGQAQSFSVSVNDTMLTKAVFNLKLSAAALGAGTATAVLYAIDSGTHGTSAIAADASPIATSETFDVTTLDSTYRPITFSFESGTVASRTLTASTNYIIAVEYTGGDITNHILVEGDTTGTHTGNQSDLNTAVWTAAAAEDLNFSVFTAPNLYDLPGNLFRGITHQVNLDTGAANSGTFSAFEPVSWPGGTGQMLAIEDTTAATADTMWIQLLTGVAPVTVELITGTTSGATATTTVASFVVSRTISTPFVGASTGSALIGSYGLGVELDDLTSSDLLTDLTAQTRQPPNNVSFTVSGVIAGEDRVLVAPWDAVTNDTEGNPDITKTQLGTDGAITGAAVTTIDVSEQILMPAALVVGEYYVITATSGSDFTNAGAIDSNPGTKFVATAGSPGGTGTVDVLIPSDTPASGDIRILLTDGSYKEVAYTSYADSIFTIVETDFSGTGAADGANVWISYIDTLATKYTLTAGLSAADENTVVVTPAIGAGVASSGTLTIKDSLGGLRTLTFDSQAASTFTLAAGTEAFNGTTAGIDAPAAVGSSVWPTTDTAESTTETFTGVYASDRDLVVIVRDGGGSPIKQFISSASLSNTGGSITAIRTSDE